jgi:methylmalonyl-CoA mutase
MEPKTTSTPTLPPLEFRRDFPPPSYADWKAAVEAELKGAPFDKKMLTPTYEGITLQPLYRREDLEGLAHVDTFPGFAPFVRGVRAAGYRAESWQISQELYAPAPAEFNRLARAALARGLTSLNMVVDHATRNGQDPDRVLAHEDVGAGGVSIATTEDVARALEGINLAQVPLFVRTGASALPFTALLAAWRRRQNKPVSELSGCIEMDPLGILAHEGRLPQSLDGAYREMALLTRWAAQHAPRLQTICVHSRAWHESGASAVQELAFALGAGVEYLRQMHHRGLDLNTVARHLRFALTVGSHFFMEIAKLRAARMLWANAVAAMGGSEEAQKLHLHVRTAHFNKSQLDPYVNLLRTTVEAFGAVVGGVQSLQVGAFDEVIRPPDDFSRRLARNIQLILQKECDLDKVIDPAGGAYYVEWLTHEIARRAWALFQEIEKRGGLAAAMRQGFPQEEVAKTRAARLKAVAQRRDTLVGVNQYANVKEEPLPAAPAVPPDFHRQRARQIEDYRSGAEETQSTTILERLNRIVNGGEEGVVEAAIEAALAGATLGEITRALRANDTPETGWQPVPLVRAAEAFEKLRQAMRAHAAQHGPLKIFLANLGPLKQHKARADFCRGFFETGGWEVIYPAGFKTPEEAAQAAVASGAPVIVICSTDDTYPALVPPLVQAVKAADPKRKVILAGYPQDQIEAHKQAGVDDFVHIRLDAAAFLSQLAKSMGVAL